MLGLIVRRQKAPCASLPIAGQPLVVRQIQYLRMLGADRIVIEHSADATFAEIESWTLDEALCANVELVATVFPIGATALALRARGTKGPIVVLDEDALCDADIRSVVADIQPASPLRVDLFAPVDGLQGTSVAVAARAEDLTIPRKGQDAAGWGVAIGDYTSAMIASGAILQKQMPAAGAPGSLWPIQVHASEDSPGVWLARGAKIEPGARITAPVLLGQDALVRSGAEVGPRAMLGRAVAVERGATVRDAFVFDETVVGEGIRIENTAADTRGLLDLVTRDRVDLDDPALLAPRHAAFSVAWSSRLVALMAVVALALPALFFGFAAGRGELFRKTYLRFGTHGIMTFEGGTGSVLCDLWLRMIDVVFARRTLVGVRGVSVSDAPATGLEMDASVAVPGAILVDGALGAEEVASSAGLRSLAWYGIAKSTRVDASLLVKSLRREPRVQVAS